MAGSRLDKVGTIFTRVQGLLKAGALQDVDKPLWYDIYKAFPPKVEPKFNRPLPTVEVKPLFAAEDFFRARFHRIYGSPGVIDLNDEKTESISEKFVGECFRLYTDGMTEENLFKKVSSNLKSVQGIELKTVEEKQAVAHEKLKSDLKTKQDQNMTKSHQFDHQKLNVSAMDIFGDKIRRVEEDGDFFDEESSDNKSKKT